MHFQIALTFEHLAAVLVEFSSVSAEGRWREKRRKKNRGKTEVRRQLCWAA